MQSVYWLVENGSNFALHAAFLAAILFVAFWLIGWRTLAFGFLMVGALACLPFLAGQRNSRAVLDCQVENPLRLVSYNVLYDNTETENVVAGLRVLDPDVIVLQETSSHWPKALKPLESVYPYKKVSWSGDLRVLSRLPFVDTDAPFDDMRRMRLVKVAVEHAGTPVRIYGVHLTKPTSGAALAVRNKQLELLAREIRAGEGPAVVAGDFNATPLSQVFQRFLADAGMERPTGTGRPLRTWPSSAPFLGLQIDHVLTSPGMRIVGARSGPDLGSNHLPISAQMTLREALPEDCAQQAP